MSATRSVLTSRWICAVVLLLALRMVMAAGYRAAVAPGPIFVGDFGVYYAAAQRWQTGKPLYMPENGKLLMQHVSSPLIPLVVRPLARYPLVKATQLWAAMNVTWLAVAVGLFCWGIGLTIPEQAGAVLLVLLCGFRFWPTTLELGVGNTDIIALMLVGGMFVCARFGKWMLFGALVALAALTKTWMIGMLFYLAVRRKWLALASSLAFLAAGAAILFTMVGWRELSGWLRMTHTYSSQPMLISNSVAGIARMFFTRNQLITPIFESRAAWAAVMVLGYGLLIFGLTAMAWRAPRMNAAQLRMCLALTPLALILGSPVSHQFYFVLALPTLWLLLLEEGHGWLVRGGTLGIYLLMSIPYPGMNPVPEVLKHGLEPLKLGDSFYCGMALWSMGLYSVLRGSRTPKHQVQESQSGPLSFAGVGA